MKELTIGEVARHAGIHTSTIRYYESVGLISPPKRVNGQRRYDASIFQRLGLIQLARQADFGIRELQVLLTSSTNWQTLASEKIAAMDELIEHAQAIKIWLLEAQQKQCAQEGDCVKVTFDDAGNVSLTCKS